MTLSRFCLCEGKARFLAEKAGEKWSTRLFRDWLSMPSLTGPGSCFEAYPALTSWAKAKAKICRRCGGCCVEDAALSSPSEPGMFGVQPSMEYPSPLVMETVSGSMHLVRS
jgi:hypothetical protein